MYLYEISNIQSSFKALSPITPINDWKRIAQGEGRIKLTLDTFTCRCEADTYRARNVSYVMDMRILVSVCVLNAQYITDSWKLKEPISGGRKHISYFLSMVSELRRSFSLFWFYLSLPHLHHVPRKDQSFTYALADSQDYQTAGVFLYFLVNNWCSLPNSFRYCKLSLYSQSQ